MLDGFPPTPFALDDQLEWVDIEPWTGERSDSLCTRESVPFLRGTAPTIYCAEADTFGYAREDLDSVYAVDTTWTATITATNPTMPPTASQAR